MSLPLKENDDVREATRSPSTLTSTLSSSSEMPSEKYSLSGSSDMLMNGRTAMDLGAPSVAPSDGPLVPAVQR